MAGVPTIYNLRSLWVRKVTTLATGLGLSLVVFVFTSVLMLGDGIDKTMASTGLPTNAKIIRKGSQNEVQSIVTPEQFRLLTAAPEIGAGKDGKALASSELLVLIFALKEGYKTTDEGANVNVRGVSAASVELHPAKQLEGRLFRPGTSEIVVGRGLVGKFDGARLGGKMNFARRDWDVVGVMDQAGSAYDSEVWGDIEQLGAAFARRPNVSSVTVKLRDSGALAALEARIATDPQLNKLEVKREDLFWSAQSKATTMFITILGIFVAVIFSVGATLGAMITMYSQVAARTREIGTLRAIGFGRLSVLWSFVRESVMLGAIAGLVGIAIASLLQFVTFSTMNFATFSETVFRFSLTPQIAGSGFFFAVLLGFFGGFLPAVRAARMPIVKATRGG
jgi:putative ABC transport system permease protein